MTNKTLQDALALGRDKERAKEEYRVATGDKEPAAWSVTETLIENNNAAEDTRHVIHITQTMPGYLEIEAYTDDPEIAFSEKVFTSADFKDWRYDFEFRICAQKLHLGRNYSKIIFRTPARERTVDVISDNKVRVFDKEKSRKNIFSNLARDYIRLRLGKISEEKWRDNALGILSSVDGTEEADLYLMLYKANVYITRESFDEAAALIEFVKERVKRMSGVRKELRCYLSYINGMAKRDDNLIEAARRETAEAYENTPSWRLLWISLYLDPSYETDTQKRYEALRREYEREPFHSPVMFYETLECLREREELLEEVTALQTETLYFAARNMALSQNLAIDFAEKVFGMREEELKKASVPLCIKVLKTAVRRFDSGIALKSLIRLLILSDSRDEAEHEFFVKAVAKFIDIPGLYRYYIYTAPKGKTELLPAAVLEYFEERSEEIGDCLDYFYACIVVNKYRQKDFYGAYLGKIRAYAAGCIAGVVSGRSLGLIYRDILESGAVSALMYRTLFDCLSLNEVTVKSKCFSSVLVFHEGLSDYSETPLTGGRAFVRMYTPDALLLFKDFSGNLYCNITYETFEPVALREYIDVCIKNAPISKYMLIGNNFEFLKAYRDPVEILDYMLENLGSGELKREYEQECLKKLISAFSSANTDETVLEKLRSFLRMDIEPFVRGMILEIMIGLRLYKEAYAQIKEHGICGVGIKPLKELSHVMAELSDYAYDEPLCKMCERCFKESGYDAEIFRYLSVNYNDDVDVLFDLYKSAKLNSLSSYEIGGRCLKRAVETKRNDALLAEIFREYFEKGQSEELKTEFITYEARRFIYGGDSGAAPYLPYVENELNRKIALEDCVTAAYLLYMAGKCAGDGDDDDNAGDDDATFANAKGDATACKIEARTIKLIDSLLKDFTRRGIMLEEFKSFKKALKLPARLSNTFVVTKISKDETEEENAPVTRGSMFGKAPKIEYEVSREGEVICHLSEPMTEIFEGCYAKYFTLFCGEKLLYGIDGGKIEEADANALEIDYDHSRFAELESMQEKLKAEDRQAFERAAVDFYVKDRLIEEMF